MTYNYLPHHNNNSLASKVLFQLGLFLSTFFRKAVDFLVPCNMHSPAYQTATTDRQLRFSCWRRVGWYGRFSQPLSLRFLSLLTLLMVSNGSVCADTNDDAIAENAIPIEFNQEVSGSLSDDNKDKAYYYKFTLPVAGNVIITLRHDMLPSDEDDSHDAHSHFGNVYYKKYVGDYLHNLELDNRQKSTSIQEGLPAGDYYFKLYSSYFYTDTHNPEQYYLKIAFEASNFYEKSPNDTDQTANPMILNQRYTGNLSNADDVDLYKFSLPTAGNVTLTLEQDNPNPFETKDYWAAQLFHQSRRIDYMDYSISVFCKGSVKSTSDQKYLMAGDYYLQIDSGNAPSISGGTGTYSPDQYHVTVSTETASSGNVEDNPTTGDTSVTGDTGNSGSSATPLEEPVIYLLLHGLNSDETTWNELVTDRFNNNCLVITANFPPENVSGLVAKQPGGETHCYVMRFLPKTVDEVVWRHGDGATDQELGDEVKIVVDLIMQHGNPKPASIILVGHSRGGLAARAYLQSRFEYESVLPVKALLTIGTPHQGSPFGRIKHFFDNNGLNFGILPDLGIEQFEKIDFDWIPDPFDSDLSSALAQLFREADITIKGEAKFAWSPSTGYLSSSFDVTRQEVRDPISEVMWQLNDDAKFLPIGNFSYGQIVSLGLPLGELKGFNILKMTFLDSLVKQFEAIKQSAGDTGSSLFNKLPDDAKNFALEIVKLIQTLSPT